MSKLAAGGIGMACLGALALLVLWILFAWWLTGVVLDWANGHWNLGLTGTPLLAVHIVAFIILGSLASVGRSATKE